MNHRAKCCLALALVFGSLSVEPRLTLPRADAVEEMREIREDSFCWLGVSSCSAASCHGGGHKGTRGSEFATFVECDPHARAYKVLCDERSQRIMKNLNDPTPAECNTLCLACHAMNPRPDLRGHRLTLVDGVACESCHGPAEKWLARHYLPEWKQLSNQNKAAIGFRPTKDLVLRAQGCADCHVGKAGQDVNHDLIAAGHPRLNFEFAAYLSNYPKHWDERAEKKHVPDLEARAWAIGQVVSARSALELLAHRAASPHAPWPEFAESSCFACHKDLSGARFEPRQQDPRRLGAIPWGNWYYARLEQALADARIEAEHSPVAALDKLRLEMEKRTPNQTTVAQLAHNAAQELSPALARLCQEQTQSAPFIRNRLEEAFLIQWNSQDTSWDQATQRYLEMAALYHALGDLNPGLRDPRWKKALKDIAGRLAFPKGQDGPGRND